ncbi:MAG: acyl-CoA carboxylase subunit beta [Candidatus Hydrogenedentes bacterium]|nr:acyl-CoA carboxylase subunit beta [Candidatus Hydrogenedentota bacterium]
MNDAHGTKPSALRALVDDILAQEAVLREGGGAAGRERQKRMNRLTARERIERLIDDPEKFFELGLWAAHKMYPDAGDVPAAGVVAGVGSIYNRPCMIIANDATVKAGAFFPQTCKKIIRAQTIAFESAIPIVYLVDSAGVYLPMQDEIFPDQDDFGRIFRNNSVLSAAGIPQIAAIMGNCIAGGAYLPVLCDKLLMTEGSGLYLAGPALVKAAIGQVVETEDLGGAAMHSQVSGTIDFREPNDEACIDRIRALVEMLPAEKWERSLEGVAGASTEKSPDTIYDLISADGRKEYEVRDLLAAIVDAGSMQEFKAEYGQTVVTTYAKIGGISVGIVANQRKRVQSKTEGVQIGGVIYYDSADKAARFVMECNQTGLPLVFIQDVVGFMVGRDSEHAGIIRCGAKLVNAMANSVVPKITMVIGGSYGAGNYAMCGKAYDPRFLFAWPNAKYAVMGADQASGTLFEIIKKSAERDGKAFDVDELNALREKVKQGYVEQADVRYGAARGWIDAIIAPHATREVLITTLRLASGKMPQARYHTGVLQT